MSNQSSLNLTLPRNSRLPYRILLYTHIVFIDGLHKMILLNLINLNLSIDVSVCGPLETSCVTSGSNVGMHEKFHITASETLKVMLLQTPNDWGREVKEDPVGRGHMVQNCILCLIDPYDADYN